MHTDEQSSAYHFTYDVDKNRVPSVSVIEAVAWIKGLQTEDLDPLHEAVDPNALDALFHPTKTGEPSVTFTYEGLEIQIDSEQHICIRGTANLIYDWLNEPANILLLAPAISSPRRAGMRRLAVRRTFRPSRRARCIVLAITRRSAHRVAEAYG